MTNKERLERLKRGELVEDLLESTHLSIQKEEELLTLLASREQLSADEKYRLLQVLSLEGKVVLSQRCEEGWFNMYLTDPLPLANQMNTVNRQGFSGIEQLYPIMNQFIFKNGTTKWWRMVELYPLALKLVSLEEKSYRLCRYATRLDSMCQWFSSYHALELICEYDR